MDIKLIVVKGASKPGEVSVDLPTVIGRSNDVDLPLRHALISRQHCELSEEDGVVVVRDLGSLNGTFVDDERITEAELRPGDLLTVGSVTFRIDYESSDNGVEKNEEDDLDYEESDTEEYDEDDTDEYDSEINEHEEGAEEEEYEEPDTEELDEDAVEESADDALNNFFNNLS